MMKYLKIIITFLLVQFIFMFKCYGALETVVLIEGDRITVQADNVPLLEILEKLEEVGIRVRIDPGIDPDITANITNRPITQVLTGLIKPYNFALVWEQVDSSEGDTIRLAEIQIFHQGKSANLDPPSSENNLEIVQGEDGIKFVARTVLLRVKKDLSKEILEALLARFHVEIVDYHKALGIIRLRVAKNTDVQKLAAELSDDPLVESAEPDYAYSLPPGLKTVFGPDSGKIESNPYQTAAGTACAVLDSGLAKEYADSSFLLGSFDAVSPGANISDSAGHGTQMALIAAGVVNPVGSESDAEYNNPVVAVRVFDDNGYTSNSTLIRGIDYAIGAGAHILSMSWGSETDSSILETAIDYASDRGMILVAAAGNSPTGKPVYPAAYENVIGVGADMPNGERWEQSNYGDFVSVYAPGLATLPVGHNGAPGTYAGTSISTAYSCRAFAQQVETNPELNQKALLENLAEEEE